MSLITITSGFGSGGEKIAQEVAKKLGIEYYDDKRIQEYALSMGFSDEDLKDFDEKPMRFFDRLFINKPAIYLEIMGAVVYDLASKGEGVIVGHGAQVFLKDFSCALHILILESEESRSKKVAKEQQIKENASMKMIKEMDKNLNQFTQYAFNRNWKNTLDYDVVINLEKLGSELAKNLIVDLATSDEIKSCSYTAFEKMELLSLEHKVEAALIKNNLNLTVKNVFVDVAEKGVVNVSGWTSSQRYADKIIDLIQNVEGVSKVNSSLTVISSIAE